MVNLKKSAVLSGLFVLFLTLFAFTGCSERKLLLQKIEGRQIAVTDSIRTSAAIENYITPYRNHIDKDLNAILAFAPQTLDKSGEWQSTVGSLQADITLAAADKLFYARQNKHVDFCLLNHGGIRSIISKGNITTRTAFELMPFENSLVVVALKGEQVLELVTYFIEGKKPHPLSGISFTIGNNGLAKNIIIQNQPFDLSKTYYIATNDYLYNGGDNMVFFKKGTAVYDLDYKLRNVWIDYFKAVDSLPFITEVRVFTEKKQ